MTTHTWTRHRLPDDVPTPVAVAVSDYCRRAKAPASPALVREALACLSEQDDFRVRELTDAEPAAGPHGPFAVVDIIAGTAPELAAERERAGYYELARALAEERASASPPPDPADEDDSASTSTGEKPRPAAAEEPPKARGRKAKPTVAEKIAPVRREAGSAPHATERPEPPPPATSFLPKRSLPAPRGRYTSVEAPKAPFEALLRPAAHDELIGLVDQVPHRVALLQALAHGYSGKRGTLVLEEVEEALKRHHLADAMAARERAAVLGALSDARGAKGRAAHALALQPGELNRVIEGAGLTREAADLRERFVREALSPQTLNLRLDLLGRGRYLEDLGIEQRFKQALTNDLEALFDENVDAAETDDALVALVAKKEGLNAELLRKAAERLGLLDSDEDE